MEGARTAPPRVPERTGPSTVASLDPLAPIIVRSGRPFDGRSDADPARFPPPSTVAGCLRTARARATDRPFGPELSRLAVAGPLLLTRTNQVLVPKPADALYFGHGGSARCLRAEPRAFDDGCGADLPDGLLPVQLTEPGAEQLTEQDAEQITEQVAGKPGDGPAWWSWDDLLAFRGGHMVTHRRLCENGWTPPRGDRRTHVAIDSDTGAADAGRLFQTEGLDLDAPDGLDAPEDGGLRLLVRCVEPLDEAFVHLGGKRRLAALQPEPEQTWPAPPQGWLDRIARAGGLSLTLLTPGMFSAGYRPGWLDANLTGTPPTALRLRLQLCAVAVDRWQPHSGWDLHRRRPRPSRKLAGAGTTCWFRILGDVDAGELDALWLTSVSDLEQDRCDGFGLALPAPGHRRADHGVERRAQTVSRRTTLMRPRLFHLHALSALHCGTGQSAGVVDLPIARARATRLPIVPGSSLRGVLRQQVTESDRNTARMLFGPDPESIKSDRDAFAGALAIGDAHLLVLPVRCLAGIVGYVTAPFILRRYARDLKRAGIPAPELPEEPAAGEAWVTPESVNRVKGKLVLAAIPAKGPVVTHGGLKPLGSKGARPSGQAPPSQCRALSTP